jgi:hypothetical protein
MEAPSLNFQFSGPRKIVFGYFCFRAVQHFVFYVSHQTTTAMFRSRLLAIDDSNSSSMEAAVVSPLRRPRRSQFILEKKCTNGSVNASFAMSSPLLSASQDIRKGVSAKSLIHKYRPLQSRAILLAEKENSHLFEVRFLCCVPGTLV